MPGRNSGEKKPRCRGVRYLNTFQRISKKVCMAIISKISQSVQSTLKSSSRPTAAGGLGILTKYVAKLFENLPDLETGEITKYSYKKLKNGTRSPANAYSQDSEDLEKGLLKKQARRILMKTELRQKRIKIVCHKLSAESELVPFFGKVALPGKLSFILEDVPNEKKNVVVHRVVNCGRDKITRDATVEVWQSKKTERCSFHKTQQCGSVWTCPTCSPKINMSRQKEIQHCYDAFLTLPESDAMLVTFTMKHGFSDKLAITFKKLKDAFRILQMSHTYKKMVGYTSTKQKNGIKTKIEIKSELDLSGIISATEITHGQNGWHPHLHQLWFFQKKLTKKEIEKLRSDLFKEWKKALLSLGMEAPIEFFNKRALGVDVRRALSAADYLTKFGSERQWGPEKELASAHSKKGKRAGRTPFQILKDSISSEDKKLRDSSSKLFQDYADATFSKHQLDFSSGLKKLLAELGVDLTQTDEDIVQSLEEDSHQLGSLTDEEFEALVKLPDSYPVEPFSTCLMICKLSGLKEAQRFIHSLPTFKLRLSPS